MKIARSSLSTATGCRDQQSARQMAGRHFSKDDHMNITWKFELGLFFLVITLCLFMAPPTQAATWVLERADTPEFVTEEQVTEWENKAREGDWQLKMEFAAAYLYDTFYPNYGCKALKYGHRCRAMAKRPEVGRVFLREVIDTEPKSHVDKVNIGDFQAFYAASLRSPAFVLEKGSEACHDKVHYYEQAFKNGDYCVGHNLESMARIGICMEQSEERAKAYRSQIPSLTGCPKD